MQYPSSLPGPVRRVVALCAAAVTLTGLCLQPAWADDTADAGPQRLRFSGFATAGLLHANVAEPWAFRRDVMQEPERRWLQYGVDTRLGLQANATLSDRFEAVGQLVLKEQTEEAPLEQRVEWAFLAYRPQPDLTLRLGRMNQDVFLLSQYSSVGYAYPWARPITAYYAWMAFTAMDGVDVTRRWNSGNATWTLRGMVGQNDLTLAGIAGESLEFHARDAFSTSLSREEGGLLLRLSYMRQRVHFTGSADPNVLKAGLVSLETGFPSASVRAQARVLRESINFDSITTQYFGAGVQYRQGPWELNGEISRAVSQADSADALKGYLSLGYRVAENVTFFGVAARSKALKPAVETPAWPAPIAPVAQVSTVLANAARHDMESGSLGLRWDFHERTALKLQWDQIHTHRWGGTMWGNATLDQRTANIYSVVVDTVF